jgi:hypothetical protein
MMERLTKRIEHEIVRNRSDNIICSNFCTGCGRADCDFIRACLDRLAEYEDIGTPEEFLAFTNTGMAPDEYDKAVKYIAWAMATFTILRHQFGPDRANEIMTAEADGRLQVLPCKVGDKVYQTDGVRVYELTVSQLVFDTETIAFDESAIGESIYLTREEAEAALEGGRP